MLILWIVVFIVALAVMIKGADWFLEAAEKMGIALGLSPFIVGVVIVGLGTSFQKLVSSLFAIFRGATEIVAANAIGSNIANILLVIGLSAIVGKRLTVSKSLIDLDIPLLAIVTALFVGFAFDGSITLVESIILIVAYGIYLAYTLLHVDDTEHGAIPSVDILPGPTNIGAKKKEDLPKKNKRRAKLSFRDFIKLIVGLLGLMLGAKYLIDSVISISDLLDIGTGAIALAAVALGTSLPEILVSVRAAWQKKSEVALGNIFGSNVFNLLLVVGIPGLFKTLVIDEQTLMLGIPVLIAATFLFIISGISRRIHIWEGSMYLLVYIFFIGKLFGLF